MTLWFLLMPSLLVYPL
ncbi:hypothetical protein E2C01_072713 [Portunus trituberculatus]|uniref:Uncharacterized protein n=1 Tax=Portunus trituberculatus TaxID=210409 RepID=A0A5B7I8L0_PORTR|nr:hypothetical protein [Portunus trituberculatus]